MSRRPSGYVQPDISGKYLGPRIKEVRNRKGIPVRKLAEDVGVEGNYISQIESGDKIPSLATFIRLANALEVTADELLCDYLVAERQVVNTKVNVDISTLNKAQQRHIEALVALEMDYMKEKN